LPSNRSLEHPAQGRPINDASLNSKTNNATRELIHHDENPMCSQRCGFTSKQIAAPQTVLHVAEEREPRWASGIRFRPVMNAQDTTNHILVDFNAKSQRDLLGDSGTTPGGITPLQFNYPIDEFFIRSFRASLTPALARKQHAALSFRQHVVEMQQRGRLQDDGGTQNACRVHEQGAQTGDDTLCGAQVGSTLAATIEDL
jgi:hypothetical protein